MLSCERFSKLSIGELTTATALVTNASTKFGSRSTATSETQSEISSADSDWSDIRSIALKLGVNNPDDLHTERFKVDRSKLEQMIKTETSDEDKNGAENFFENVMKNYNTHISWPCRLKIGAKSKKDPHVRIVGKSEDVQRAKDLILESLDSRVTRVIMKMDVSYTDHSFIIGRGGNNIKHIMEDTATHIHFPDSNRSNPTEKSNQVSLCGSLEGVERARALVRLSTPLLISFELPILAHGCQQPDHETPYVKMIETKYNVQIIFSSRPKLHSSLVLVKGAEKGAKQVQEATQLLINFSCENVASQILVNMQIEISPQHHEIVKGKNNEHLLNIMQRTKTKIIFPDLSDMNIKPLKKSQITITGTINGVYNARQQLLGNLPIMLIFDYPDNQNNAAEIMHLSIKYGVFISLRQKQRQSTLAVVIKGVEKFVDKIYEARHEILNQNMPLVKPLLPDTYFSPKDNEQSIGFRTSLISLLSGHPDSPKSGKNFYNNNNNNNNSNNNNNNNNNNNSNNNNNDLANNNLLFNNQKQQQQQQTTNYSKIYSATTSPSSICSPTQKYIQMHNNNFLRQQQQQNNHNFIQVVQATSTSSTNSQQQQQQTQQLGHQNALSPRNSCHNTSGYQSFSSSTTSLEQACAPFGNNNGNGNVSGSSSNSNSSGVTGGANGTLLNHQNIIGLNMASDANLGNSCMQAKLMQYSPDSTFNSDLAGRSRLGRRSSDGVLLGLGSSGLTSIPLVPGSAESYRNLNFDVKNNRAFDYDAKRVMGFKAMERAPVSGEVRTPNSHWMGLSLSHTSPAPLETVDDFKTWHNNNSVIDNALTGTTVCNRGGSNNLSSNYGLNSTTGVMDSTPTNRRLQLSKHKDIHSLLTSLGLEHYIKIFVLNEIDLEIFTTLTEENLMELGITAFGARRKLMVAVHTLQANDGTPIMPKTVNTSGNLSSPRFSGSAAPGAERRPSNQW